MANQYDSDDPEPIDKDTNLFITILVFISILICLIISIGRILLES